MHVNISSLIEINVVLDHSLLILISHVLFGMLEVVVHLIEVASELTIYNLNLLAIARDSPAPLGVDAAYSDHQLTLLLEGTSVEDINLLLSQTGVH